MDALHEFGIQLWRMLLPYLATGAAGLVIVGLKYLLDYAKGRAKAVENDLLRGLIEQAVTAAEQLFDSGEGEKKYKYVEEWFAERCISVDKAEIEAVVYWLSKHIKQADAPAPLEAA